MEKKKEQIGSKLKIIEDQEMKEQSSSDIESEDEEIPEFIDWRAKKSHK